MRIELATVGSSAPRSRRGKTFLPAGLITPKVAWGTRAVLVLLMAVLALPSLLVGAWWGWGLRRRLWRWHVAAAGLLTVPLVALAASPGAGVGLWRWFLNGATIGGITITAVPLDVAGLLASSWVIGTIVGCHMSFLAWYRTPPWRDKARPKSMVTRWREKRLVDALHTGEHDTPGVVTFGIDTDTGQPVELPWKDTEGHMLVTGSPGSGKTTSAMKVVRAAIRDGMFTAIVDMKADQSIIEQVSAWCTRWDRPLWVFSMEGPCRYDPFMKGDYTRKRDLLMATSQWPEPYYKSVAQDYLLQVFFVLERLGVDPVRGVLPRVVEMLDPNVLIQESFKLDPNDPEFEDAKARVNRVAGTALANPMALAGLIPRVRALTDTTLGAWTMPGEPAIDLDAIFQRNGVVIFSLPTLTHKEDAAAFGGLAVQDLKTLAGILQSRQNTQNGLVFVDEFSTLGAANIVDALAMGRASKLRWMLATQDLGDLATGPDGKAFEQKVLTDTNIKIMHAVGDADTADKLSRLSGVKWAVNERTAINQSDSAIDITSGTQSGHGFAEWAKVPVIEANDILHQGSGTDSTFTLINKPGLVAITGAHTVPDLSGVTDDQRLASSAVQHLPGSQPRPTRSSGTPTEKIPNPPPGPALPKAVFAPPAEDPDDAPVSPAAQAALDNAFASIQGRLEEARRQQAAEAAVAAAHETAATVRDARAAHIAATTRPASPATAAPASRPSPPADPIGGWW